MAGTGKTTWLARQIEQAAEKYGPEEIVVASYTKAAAEELNSRRLSLPQGNIGTLHSLCYRAMGSPELAGNHVDEFNAKYPHWTLSKTTNGAMDEMAADAHFATEGDSYIAMYDIHRARMIHMDRLPEKIKKFVMAYEGWKMLNNYVDFTDMIQHTIISETELPGNPRVGFFDECQDFSPISLLLLRTWAKKQEFVIMAGDDDQTIFEWAGASAEAFLNPPVDADHKRVLTQSWRLPRAVQNYAVKWISQVKNREVKEYLPRDFEGSVMRINSNIIDPRLAIEQAWRLTEEGKTVMILTTCAYMLTAVKKVLRDYGIAYHNPFRPQRGDWNPLGSFAVKKYVKGRTSTRERILAFLDRSKGDFWEPNGLAKWTDAMKVKGVLRKGGKGKIEDAIDPDTGVWTTTDLDWYKEVFEPAALEMAVGRNLDWFMESLLSSKFAVSEYPVSIYKKSGADALLKVPKITIGTVHSVKGGECDVTFLFPDISRPAWEAQRSSDAGFDAMVRTFYVGMTRCRESLVLCNPSNNLYVKM